ncbi:YcgN family cysteine cluster protein [Acinetobacter rathckeae]|uniref:YcgN family cysteine cluster protein n=1 Tax=Acinetobacter rathckeae TaxID=2605272 RepID=UPI003898EBF0
MGLGMSLRPQFWQKYPLDALNAQEWEALCDGCGLCCLIKLEDDDTQEVTYTKVACHLLDCSTGHCSDYTHRKNFVPDCIQLNIQTIEQIAYWLPSSCAYRRRHEGKKLPPWHYLNTGSRESVITAKKSVAGRCISEYDIPEQDIDQYIVRWVR